MKYLTIFLALALTACASSQPKTSYYVSPSEYNGYSCEQLSREFDRITAKRQQALTHGQTESIFDTALKAYSISQGYGYSDNDNGELDALNNTYEVLERLLIKEGCH